MTRYKLLFLICFICFTSCSDDQTSYDKPEQVQLTHTPEDPLVGTKYGEYNLLGYGYNMTGSYFDETSASKEAILDIDAIDNDPSIAHYRPITEMNTPSSTYLEAGGKTVFEFLTNLTKETKIGYAAGHKIYRAFSGTINRNWTSDEITKNSSFAIFQRLFTFKRLQVGLNPNQLRNYLTPQFKKDLTALSDLEIIEKYGTHVLTCIYLGAKIEIVLKVENTNINDLDFILSAGIKLFKYNTDAAYDQSLTMVNTPFSIKYKTFGGDPSLRKRGTISKDKSGELAKYDGVDLTDWIRSINESNYAFINSKDYSAEPIFNFVEDPIKKESLERAVRQYIIDAEYIDIR